LVDDNGFSEGVAFFTDMTQSSHDHFWWHSIAHLFMLHGAVSDGVLPFSQYAFNPPAWSLSLEWQFYLVAPLVVILGSQWRTLIWVAAAVAIIELLYTIGGLGNYRGQAFLPGVAEYFAVGIVSRFVYPTIAGTLRRPAVIFALVLIFLPLGRELLPILAWALVMAYLCVDYSSRDAKVFVRISRLALEGRLATYWGERSYSIYLWHSPILAICYAIVVHIFPTLGRIGTIALVSISSVPLIMSTAVLSYRFIERPGMALGSKLIGRKSLAIAAA
jgi:peptidoglycan/LPS O-acetylase OafA/YrhL